MIQEIRSKWIVKYKDWHIIITENKELYDAITLIRLVPYWNNGALSWRIPKTTRRIGEKTMRKYAVKEKKVFQDYIPF